MKRTIRWLASRWCDYSCSYCRQQHGRKQTYRGAPGHWADNAPVEKWVEAIRRHGVQVVNLTGGEVMLDYKNIRPLLEGLGFAESIRVDTNGNFRPWPSPPNVQLMVSYHPEMRALSEFLMQVDGLRDAGWRVAYLSFVAVPDTVDRLDDLRGVLKDRGYLMSVIPLDGIADHYSDAHLDILRRHIPSEDWHFRTGGATAGTPCNYPALAWEMFPDGSLEVACHPHLSGSVFDDALPRPLEAPLCPRDRCVCQERYAHTFEDPDVPTVNSFARRLSLL